MALPSYGHLKLRGQNDQKGIMYLKGQGGAMELDRVIVAISAIRVLWTTG